MTAPEAQLAGARDRLIESLVMALEAGVPLARCLDILGVQGKAATMIRAFVSRYSEAEIAEALRSYKSPDSGMVAEPAPVD